MNRYELSCMYDSANSFYKKAIVEIEEDNIVKTYKLYSYNTLVALVSYDKLSSLIQYDYLGHFNGILNDKDMKELFKICKNKN